MSFSQSPNPEPIFILGILQRSGTNYLYDLIRRHPDCWARAGWSTSVEDYLLRRSDLLLKYAGVSDAFWQKVWGTPGEEDLLCECLGRGLAAFLSAGAGGKRIVTKTPSVFNLPHFPKLFPGAHLLILVRDGRAIAESTLRTFGRDYEFTTRMWAYGAHVIREFIRAHDPTGPCKYLVVRYEDLVDNLREELTRVLTFLELDVAAYDFDAAQRLPVRGSSTHRGQSDKIHWGPVERTADFRPLQRFAHWSPAMHRRFNWIAGREMRQFGYEEEHPSRRTFARIMWNRLLDVKWKARCLWERFFPRPEEKPQAEKMAAAEQRKGPANLEV
jgi:hypothetical protein